MTPASIPERPLLKPWYRLAREPGRTVLEHAHVAVVFEGRANERLLPALLPLLDGTRVVRELVDELGEAAEPAVHNALALLARHRLLTDGPESAGEPPGPADEAARFLSALSPRELSPPGAAEIVARAWTTVVGSGRVAEHVARMLRLSGVRRVEHASVAEPAPGADLSVVVPEPAELPALAEWNDGALAAGRPWLAVLPFDGRFAAVGPLFVPGETACYECYRIRRASNLEYADEYWALEQEPSAAPLAPAFVACLAGLAVMVTLRWLTDRDAALPGAFAALEPAGVPGLTRHQVYRVPRCPACSDAERLALASPWFDGELLT